MIFWACFYAFPFKLADDPDPSVKNGAELLDRLIKDIVTEKPAFDVDAFIPLLSERVNSIKPHVRQVGDCNEIVISVRLHAVPRGLDQCAGLRAGHRLD